MLFGFYCPRRVTDAMKETAITRQRRRRAETMLVFVRDQTRSIQPYFYRQHTMWSLFLVGADDIFCLFCANLEFLWERCR